MKKKAVRTAVIVLASVGLSCALSCAGGDESPSDGAQDGGAPEGGGGFVDASTGFDAGAPVDDASMIVVDATPDTGTDAGPAIPRDSLVGEWLFEGQAKDTSGNFNNGVVNGATLTADRKNRALSAYLFDGQSQIAVTDTNVLDVTTSYAISVWVRPDAFGSLLGIVSKYQTNNAKGPTLRLTQGSPFQGIDCNDGSNGVAGAQGLLMVGKWHHVVANVMGQSVNVWLDAVKAYTGNASFATIANSDPLVIGLDFGNRFFQGAIDQVRLYSRVLTPAEIQALYNEP